MSAIDSITDTPRPQLVLGVTEVDSENAVRVHSPEYGSVVAASHSFIIRYASVTAEYSEKKAIIFQELGDTDSATTHFLTAGELYRKRRLFEKSREMYAYVLGMDPKHIRAYQGLFETGVMEMDSGVANHAYRQLSKLGVPPEQSYMERTSAMAAKPVPRVHSTADTLRMSPVNDRAATASVT